jgi:hypothetical protein
VLWSKRGELASLNEVLVNPDSGKCQQNSSRTLPAYSIYHLRNLTLLIILIISQQFEQSLDSHRAMDPTTTTGVQFGVRTILGTIDLLLLQVESLQEPNSLQRVHSNLLRLQRELTNSFTAQDQYVFVIVLVILLTLSNSFTERISSTIQSMPQK